MLSLPRNRKAGFTVTEIVIVVAILVTLEVVAVPNFLSARRRVQAEEVLKELRLLDKAQMMYSTQNPGNAAASGWLDSRPYIKRGTRLYKAFSGEGATAEVKDIYGHDFKSHTDVKGKKRVYLNLDTFNALSDVAPAEFWSPYR